MRNFKNIPALNGHMRLHGGYLKKDIEKLKLRKEKAPQLMTASIGVRTLIGEKIFNKRNNDQVIVNEPNSTSIKPFTVISGESFNRTRSEMFDNNSRKEVFIPASICNKETWNCTNNSIMMLKNDNNLKRQKMNKSIRQFVYPICGTSNIEQFKKMLNFQVIQKDLIKLRAEEPHQLIIKQLTSDKSRSTKNKDIIIETNQQLLNFSCSKKDLYNASEEKTITENSPMVKLSDPLLSETSKTTESNQKYVYKIKLNDQRKGYADKSGHYRPYPILTKETRSSKSNLYFNAKINIGANYQIDVPDIVLTKYQHFDTNDTSVCLWNPCLLSKEVVNQYCTFIQSDVFNAFFKNEENGLKLLYENNGLIHLAISQMLHQKKLAQPKDIWKKDEFEIFINFLRKKGKKFDSMSKCIKTKSVFECIQLYYLVKKAIFKKK
uniref:CSON003061 protein n=1 Tax=Culicoides sonorensis TaxID=179676 RepID=A0A336MMU0_CULSO